MRFARIISVWGLALAATCALANPTGPQVVHGSATFSQPNANTLNVTNSHNAIINWQGFNIGAGQTTNFIQPGSNSAVLNRVLSNSPSQILGNLNSNGKVFLINQHGLMIGAGAQINTTGFYGSTLNITNEDFLNGNLKFDGGGLGGIVNQGYIHAGPNGNVVLIAPDIENGGVIEVDNGNVILAAGESIRITSLNDASIEFDVQSPDNGIINLGDIIVKQGAARLFAGNLKHSGAIDATGIVQNADGSISLVAQQDIEISAGATLNTDGDTGGEILVQSLHGDVYFEGTASARGRTHHGGRIEILGDRVGLFGDALVDASGVNGGGEVLVGGDFQGKGDIQTASQTQVGPHAEIHADAIELGDGGKVIVWADDLTLFQGGATAKGGASAGDGGFIEISGKGSLGFDGAADATSEYGETGTVLFDPIDITIQVSGGLTILPANPLTFSTNPGQLLTIAPAAITGVTDLGNNVILQADRDIIVNDPISTNEGGAGGDLTFQAGRSILINADIFTDNGTLLLYANAAVHPVTPAPGPDPTNRGTGQAEITMLPGSTVDAGTGNVEFWMNSGVNGTAGNITVGNVKADHVLIKHNGLDDFGSIQQNNGDTITALSVFIDHDGPNNGTVGSPDPPLNLVVDNVGAHIHEPTIFGIYLNAQPNSVADVSIGNTCYGTGIAPGCDTFGPHLVRGLETIGGGGGIELNVIGNLVVAAEPVRVDDTFATGNPGDILLSATGTITSSNDIYNNVTGGTVTLNSINPITLNGGSYRGTFQTQAGGTPQVSGTVTLDKVVLDTDAIILDVGTINVIDSLDILAGRTLTFASTGMNSTLGTLSPTVDLNGPGSIVFGGTTTSNQILVGANTTLTIGTNLLLSGQGLIDATAASSALINNGVLSSDGFGLTLNALVWNNNGSVIAANNSTLTLQGATLNNDGILQVDAGSSISTLNQDFFNLPGGLVQGAGNFIVGTGVFTNDGTVAPGTGANDISILNITGNYTQGSVGLLDIELEGKVPGTGSGFHDQLFVSSTATLDGDLTITNIGGFVQAPADNYRVLESGTAVVGNFLGTVSLPATINPPVYGTTFVDLPSSVSGAFVWIGAGDGTNWDDAMNWNFGMPTIADDVIIGAVSVTAAGGGNANTLALGNGGSLNIAGGTLTIANGLTLAGSLRVASTATLNVQDGAAVNDITVNPGGSLIVNGGTINSFGNSLFNGSFTQNLASAVSTFFGPATFNGPFNLNNGSLQLGTMTMLAGTNNTWTGGTLGGSGPLVLGLASADGTTLAISGAATKTLDTITLAMNQNDINMSGSGNLSLVNGAVIDNTGGTSFNHSGNGGITGTGTFDNTNGTFNKLSGSAVIAPTVTFINTGSSLVDIAGGALTFVAGGADAGNYSVRSAGTLAFTNGKTLAAGSTLNLAGNLVVGNGLSPTTLTLPGTLNNTGNIQLNNARLDLTNLGGTLSLTGGARLGGSGTVAGNLVNANGVIVVGGAGTLGNLAISGSYDQGANSAIVVEAFNNGFTTVFDQLTIGGPSTLNGGTLVIGFTTNSLGLVTANFSPITASSGVSGGFSRIIDAGGNILFINFNSGVFTILGASPKIPDKVIDDLISFLKKNGEQLAEEIARNRSQAEAIIEALLKEEAPGQDGLVCN